MVLPVPINLIESMAVVPVRCSHCLSDIDIGDTCYIDTSKGVEEHSAKIYCTDCKNIFYDIS
jgi:hypothetical protein